MPALLNHYLAIHSWMHGARVREGASGAERSSDHDIFYHVDVGGETGDRVRKNDVVIVTENIESHDRPRGHSDREGTEGVARREYIHRGRSRRARAVAGPGTAEQRNDADEQDSFRVQGRGHSRQCGAAHDAGARATARVRRRVRVAALASIAAFAAACGGSDAGPSGPAQPTTPVAAYSLTLVDAKALPAVMFSDTGYTVEVTEGTLSLTADLKFTGSVTTRETVDGNISFYIDRVSGNWSKASGSSTVTLNPTGGTAQSAVWAGTPGTPWSRVSSSSRKRRPPGRRCVRRTIRTS